MASAPFLTNLSWENGVPVLYIAQGTKINVNLQNYVYDADGNTITITLNSSSLPSGLTYSNGIISGTTTSTISGSLNIKLVDSTGLTNTQTITVKTVNSSLISTDEANLIYVLGATDTSFTKATTSNTKTFFEVNEYDGGFSKVSIVSGKVTVKDYYDDGNLTVDSSETFTMTDTIGADKILDTVASTWATETFTYGEAKAVTSINGIATPGLYKVDVKTTVKTPGTVEKSTDWWENGYSYNGNDITSLSTLVTMLTTTNTKVWMDGDKQVKLLAGGKVVSTVNDGSLNTWNDDGTYEYNNVPTSTQIGTWTNSTTTGYLKVTLYTGEVSAFKISSGTLMQTSLPSTGFTETMTWYYGSGLTETSFNAKYQAIAPIKAINATGTTSTDTIIGNSYNNVLDGKAGADKLIGGLGNDTYIVDNTLDVVTELASQGIDTINSLVSYSISANVENLTLTGYSLINGTGNTLNNIITGNSAANILDGKIGVDTLKGGAGNDTYIVDNVKDTVTELASQGTDTINSSVSYTLSLNVENLTLTGIAVINGTGNGLNNTIIGNSANNVIDGKVGADTLIGGLGNDTYVVDNTSDKITEALNAGTDIVNSTASYTLSTNVENLTLTGISVINGTGNTLNNIITGNSVNNVLNGGTGVDKLIGGLGNDTYIVDNTLDGVIELASQGIDTINSSVSYTLSANVENLTLIGTSIINGTGNTLNNIITGNSANNIIKSGLGNDTLNGGLGNDILYGGIGLDKFVFNTALHSTNKDTIKDFSVVDDTIILENTIFTKLTTVGTLKTANFKSNIDGLAKDADDYLVYQTDTGKLFYDADGNAAGDAIQIALIENKATLTYSDFTVI